MLIRKNYPVRDNFVTEKAISLKNAALKNLKKVQPSLELLIHKVWLHKNKDQSLKGFLNN